MAKVGSMFFDVQANVFKFTGPIKRAKKQLSLFGRVSLATNKGFKRLNSSFGTFALKAAAVALALRTASIALKGAVSPAADLEESLNRVSGVMGNLPTGAFDAIKEKARELGRTTEFTAGQAADGFRLLAMAGLDATEALQAIKPALNLASAGGIELSESADQVTNIMGQMGIAFSETERAVDVLAKTASSSNTTVTEMAEAFKFAGPTARALGVEIEEVAAVIGTLANSGLKAGIGTRALSTALAGLASPETGRKLKEQLDIAAFTDEGKFIGIIDLIDEMNKAFVGLTDQTRLSVISDVFGKNALQEMDVLLNAGVGSLREFETSLKNAGGAAQTMADANLKGLNGQIKKMKSAFQDVLISLGDAGLLKLLTETSKRFTDLFSTLSESRVVFEFFEASVRNLKIAMESMEFVVKTFIIGWKAIGEAISFVFTKSLDLVDFWQNVFIGTLRKVTKAMENTFLFVSKIIQDSLTLILNSLVFTVEMFGKLDGLPGVKIDVSGALESLENLRAKMLEAGKFINKGISATFDIVPPSVPSIREIADDFVSVFIRFIKSQKSKMDDAWATLTEPLKEKMILSAGEAFEFVKEQVEAFSKSPEVEELGNKAKQFSKDWVKFGVTMQDTIVNAAIEFKSFGDLVGDILNKIRENMIKSFLLGKIDVAGNRSGGLLENLFSTSVGGGIGKFFGGLFKAKGGPVSKGGLHVVGEEGPELFTPSQNGSIIPNNKLGNLTPGKNGIGGEAKTIQVTNNFEIRGSDQEVQRMIAQSVKMSVSLAISENQNLKQRGFIR